MFIYCLWKPHFWGVAFTSIAWKNSWHFASTSQKHYPDLSSWDMSSVWNFCDHSSAVISQGKRLVVLENVSCFLSLISSWKYSSHICILALINDKGIAKILYGGSLCNVEIHAVTCFGCGGSSERGTSLQNSCIDDSHSKREQIILFCLFQSHCGPYKNCWWKYFDTHTKPFSTKWAFKRWLVSREKHRGKKKCESFCYSLLFLPIQGQQPSQTAPLEQVLINIYK